MCYRVFLVKGLLIGYTSSFNTHGYNFGAITTSPKRNMAVFLVPTAPGQYIIKNVVLIAATIGIAQHLHPIPSKIDFTLFCDTINVYGR